MRQLLGGGAAALVGATIPMGLRSDEMALVDERVTYGFKDNVLTVTNLTRHPIEVRATMYTPGVRIDGNAHFMGPDPWGGDAVWAHWPDGSLVLNLGDSFHKKALAV